MCALSRSTPTGSTVVVHAGLQQPRLDLELVGRPGPRVLFSELVGDMLGFFVEE